MIAPESPTADDPRPSDDELRALKTICDAKHVDAFNPAVAASICDALLAERAAHLATKAAQRETLEFLVTFFEGDCQLDHHGYCQAHYLGDPCLVPKWRAALADPEEPQTGEKVNENR